MARIVGAIATSHTPTIGCAYDRKKQGDLERAPFSEAFRPILWGLARSKSDLLFCVHDDHVTSFSFDNASAFALAIGEAVEREA